MNKKQILTLTVLAVLIVVVVVLGLFMDLEKESIRPSDPSATSTEVSDEPDLGGIPDFTEEVDESVEETEPDEVIEVVTDPEKNESLGGYTVSASRSGYSPDVLTVVAGNIVRLTLRSEDGKYDLAIPAMSIYISAPEGEEKQTSFRVNQSGTFRFECQDFCPRGGEIYGRFIVKPRD